MRCQSCGRGCNVLPRSWKKEGEAIHCPDCWDQATCKKCGDHDPNGHQRFGQWECRACRDRKQRKGKFSSNTHEDCHRTIIGDQNGEDMQMPTILSEEVKWRKKSLDNGLPSVLEDAVEEDDELAPLPTHHAMVKNSRPQATHIIVLLDASGSMRTRDVITKESGQEDVICRLEAALACALRFVEMRAEMQPEDLFSVACFDDDADIVVKLQNAKAARAAFESLASHGRGGTSYKAALHAAHKLMSLRPEMKSHIVILSDGRPADAKAALEFLQAKFEVEQDAGMYVHGIGFGVTVQSFAPLQQLTCLGRGTFELSSCNMRSLNKAFGFVSSSISSISSGCKPSREHQVEECVPKPRSVHFEPPEVGVFGKRGVLRFCAMRSTFKYDGAQFHEESWPASEVARRTQPFMRGGMRLVYAFHDRQVVQRQEEGGWMVAKTSRFAGDPFNARSVVEAHVKCTAIARHYAACFNKQLSSGSNHDCKEPALFFVPCYLYSVQHDATLPKHEPHIFAGEHYLPGAFLKHNSNNGFVRHSDSLHQDAIQAFMHFSFSASEGKHLVADLQGVSREGEVLLTDPQVLSLDGQYGPGDLRARGMHACLAAHRCGRTCRRLGLPPVSRTLLSRLQARARADGTAHRAEAASAQSWAKLSELGASSAEWDKVSECGLEHYALSEGGGQSGPGSESSWVHVLNM
mmetsp:Transcript_39647/g.71118  ORF Transcript_39647/g.71118 Transcript_39647/m.71118 type:complete len:691 (-) Transcript_39647:19-2091(-)